MSRVVWTRVASLLPGKADYAGLRTSWKGDVIAGMTVGVVALPLALAFGITAGLGARAGLIIEDLEKRHITVLLKGPKPEHLRMLHEVGAIGRLAHENHLFGDMSAAIDHARAHRRRVA